MPKLRAVQHRKHEIPTQFDLRGIGGDPLFDQSAPYACLLVEGSIPEADFESWARAFGLTVEASPEGKRVQSKSANPHDHCHQAATLFVAALDLLRNHTQIRAHLLELQPLRHALKSALRGRRQSAAPLEIGAHRIPGASLTLDAVVTHHLHRAGFNIEPSQAVAALRPGDIHRHQQALGRAGAEEARYLGRKAG